MKNFPMVIRPAEFHDVESIFRLIKHYPNELLPRAISDIVQNIDRFLVGEMNGKVVGTVSWQILPEIGADKAPSVEIKSVAIENSLRRKGLGQALVQGAINRIRTIQPCQIIVLTFTPDFFASMGFKVVSKRKLIHKIYAGCINCTKYDSPFTCPEVAMALVLSPSTTVKRSITKRKATT
ncbi:MAG: hypothetical protein A2340_02600 [Lentisphaerae bacterium RIFOXYB12_FULL_60_10]|nr:MAG: hypothetical protein A2340_02600 [Lentisphaerae bacterium RIFOXYB12_FULL_60_10]